MTFTKTPCVFLDRDGIINRNRPNGMCVTQWPEFEFLPGVGLAIRKLNQSGFKVIVVTNQRGIALGLYSIEELEGIHARMRKSLEADGARIDAIYYCPHDRDCRICRKPATGMFRQALADFPQLSLEHSVMIGDSVSDMQAGRAFGLRTIMVSNTHAATQGIELADTMVCTLLQAISIVTNGNSFCRLQKHQRPIPPAG